MKPDEIPMTPATDEIPDDFAEAYETPQGRNLGYEMLKDKIESLEKRVIELEKKL